MSDGGERNGRRLIGGEINAGIADGGGGVSDQSHTSSFP